MGYFTIMEFEDLLKLLVHQCPTNYQFISEPILTIIIELVELMIYLFRNLLHFNLIHLNNHTIHSTIQYYFPSIPPHQIHLLLYL